MDVVPFHLLANNHLECLPVGEHQQRAVTQHYWEPKLSPKNVVKYSARRYFKESWFDTLNETKTKLMQVKTKSGSERRRDGHDLAVCSEIRVQCAL